jgi:hypothetical protein
MSDPRAIPRMSAAPPRVTRYAGIKSDNIEVTEAAGKPHVDFKSTPRMGSALGFARALPLIPESLVQLRLSLRL